MATSAEDLRGSPDRGSQGAIVAALIGAGSSLLTNAWQAHRADTAHQREVRDLQRAGLNPALSAMGGRGAEVGDIRDPGERGISSALAARRLQAETALLAEQARLTADQGALARTQAADIQQGWNAGRWDLIREQVEGARLSNEQLRGMLPSVIARAREEVEMTAASARQARARARLDELEEVGRMNEAEMEKWLTEFRDVGESFGPAARMLMLILNRLSRR